MFFRSPCPIEFSATLRKNCVKWRSSPLHRFSQENTLTAQRILARKLMLNCCNIFFYVKPSIFMAGKLRLRGSFLAP